MKTSLGGRVPGRQWQGCWARCTAEPTPNYSTEPVLKEGFCEINKREREEQKSVEYTAFEHNAFHEAPRKQKMDPNEIANFKGTTRIDSNQRIEQRLQW